jgi:hypothetical protein
MTATFRRRLHGILLAACLAACCWPLARPGLALGQAAAAGEVAPLGAAELEALVGPVALYPDELLAIVLPASAYPLQIVQAARLLERAEHGGDVEPDPDWDDSVVALLNYPEVLALLNEDLDWTWRLGEAVIAQQAEVLAAVAAFREKAYAAGNLHSDEHQLVQRNGQVIEVKPVEKEVIYVPYYAPREVVVYQTLPVYHYYPLARPLYYYPYTGGIWFGNSAFWGVSSFFSLGWTTRHVYVYHHHNIHHPYYGRHYREDRYRSRRHADRSDRDESDNPRWRADPRQRIYRHDWQGSRPEAGRYPNLRPAPAPGTRASPEHTSGSPRDNGERNQGEHHVREHPAPAANVQAISRPVRRPAAEPSPASAAGTPQAPKRAETAGDRQPAARAPVTPRGERQAAADGRRESPLVAPGHKQEPASRAREAHRQAVPASPRRGAVTARDLHPAGPDSQVAPRSEQRGAQPASRLEQRGFQAAPRSAQRGAQAVPRLEQRGAQPVPRSAQPGAQAVPHLERRGAQPVPRSAQRGAQAVPRLEQRGAQPVPRSAQRGAQAVPHLEQRGSQPVPRAATPAPNSDLRAATRGSAGRGAAPEAVHRGEAREAYSRRTRSADSRNRGDDH